jgi:WD40 repeat protein
VTASEDFTAIIWDISTGKQIAPALVHRDRVQSARFSEDGAWVVTASLDQTARIWSAETGDPVTPPLRHLARLVDAKFGPDNFSIASADANGTVSVWDIPVERRPVPDLVRLARFLSGQTASSAHMEKPTGHQRTLESEWGELRRAHPSDFKTSPSELREWHAVQSQAAEVNQQWFAAAFHLKQLLMLDPGNESVIRRLATAEERIESAR